MVLPYVRMRGRFVAFCHAAFLSFTHPCYSLTMITRKPKIRLFVQDRLSADAIVGLPADQSHYLKHVMRRKQGDQVALFNGQDGEWAAEIDGLGKGWASLALKEQLQPQSPEPDLWLCFAPIKRTRIDFLVEKATELGVSRLQPVVTRNTNSARVNLHRMTARVIEAAEQCERLSVPEIMDAKSLLEMLENWPDDRPLLFCDEREGAKGLVEVAASRNGEAYAFLIGPEGGFSEDERMILLEHSNTQSITLGPRILRAETAALAALGAWQALVG
jgi:16S rRNA (uracil1498-N3)-methyltransferase